MSQTVQILYTVANLDTYTVQVFYTVDNLDISNCTDTLHSRYFNKTQSIDGMMTMYS